MDLLVAESHGMLQQYVDDVQRMIHHTIAAAVQLGICPLTDRVDPATLDVIAQALLREFPKLDPRWRHEPALWCSGIADGLRAWRWQLAAVRLPPGPGRESWRGTQTTAQYNAATGPYWPKGARKKKAPDGDMTLWPNCDIACDEGVLLWELLFLPFFLPAVVAVFCWIACWGVVCLCCGFCVLGCIVVLLLLVGLAKVPQPWLLVVMQLLAQKPRLQLHAFILEKQAAWVKAQPVIFPGDCANVHSWRGSHRSP